MRPHIKRIIGHETMSGAFVCAEGILVKYFVEEVPGRGNPNHTIITEINGFPDPYSVIQESRGNLSNSFGSPWTERPTA